MKYSRLTTSFLTGLLATGSASMGFSQTTVTLDGSSGSQTYDVARTTDNGGLTLSMGIQVEYLIVGGGGGGGGGYDTGGGGGGGAGMVLAGSTILTAGDYAVTVGAGGAASTANYSAGPKETWGGAGGDSSFASITALGGGGGRSSRSYTGAFGSGGAIQGASLATTGGSGGGNTGVSVSGGSGGGGGGAGSGGGAGTSSAGGAGGAAAISSISGSNVSYGRGGSGARGGIITTGASGAANTGNGGGGGGYGSFGSGTGGAGGSGVVIVRYLGSAEGTGGTTTSGSGSAAGYTLHRFTNTGSNSLNLSLSNVGSNFGAAQSGVISGSGDLRFNGPGKLTLKATNTYSGLTRVNAGTLAIGASGSIASSSGVSLSANTTLDVSAVTGGFTLGSTQNLSGGGTVVGDVIIAGAHTPGFSPGMQTIDGNLTYSVGSSITWELADNVIAGRGTSWDAINVTGNLNFSGSTSLLMSFDPLASGSFTGSTVDFTNSFWNAPLGTGGAGWKIFQVSGTISGLGNLAIEGSGWLDHYGNSFSDLHPNQSFMLYQSGDGVYLTTTTASPVPEPGAALLGSFGIMALLRRRR